MENSKSLIKLLKISQNQKHFWSVFGSKEPCLLFLMSSVSSKNYSGPAGVRPPTPLKYFFRYWSINSILLPSSIQYWAFQLSITRRTLLYQRQKFNCYLCCSLLQCLSIPVRSVSITETGFGENFSRGDEKIILYRTVMMESMLILQVCLVIGAPIVWIQKTSVKAAG